jgi:hypothetical protein
MRPSNIWIRHNMTTAEWIDIFEKLKARNLLAFHLDVVDNTTEDLV